MRKQITGEAVLRRLVLDRWTVSFEAQNEITLYSGHLRERISFNHIHVLIFAHVRSFGAKASDQIASQQLSELLRIAIENLLRDVAID